MSNETDMFKYDDIRAAHIKKLDAEATKALAEAHKANIEADMARLESRANADRLSNEAARLVAESQQLYTENNKLCIELAELEIRHKNALRDQAEKEAGNKYHHVYTFTDSTSESAVNSCILQCDQWRRISKASGDIVPQIDIVFSSPGGSVIDGLRLFDYLQEVRRDGIKVITGTYGMAASMAGILLQAGETRWAGRYAQVLIHEIQAQSLGKLPEMEDQVKWLKRIQEQVIDIFAQRIWELVEAGKTVGPLASDLYENGLTTWTDIEAVKKYLRMHWNRRDWWLSAKECLSLGLVDQVR